MLLVRFSPPKSFTAPWGPARDSGWALFVGLVQLGQLLEGGGFGGLMLNLVVGVREVVGRVFEFAGEIMGSVVGGVGELLGLVESGVGFVTSALGPGTLRRGALAQHGGQPGGGVGHVRGGRGIVGGGSGRERIAAHAMPILLRLENEVDRAPV